MRIPDPGPTEWGAPQVPARDTFQPELVERVERALLAYGPIRDLNPAVQHNLLMSICGSCGPLLDSFQAAGYAQAIKDVAEALSVNFPCGDDDPADFIESRFSAPSPGPEEEGDDRKTESIHHPEIEAVAREMREYIDRMRIDGIDLPAFCVEGWANRLDAVSGKEGDR